MEESEKRAERLRAMRMDAASQTSSPSPFPYSYTNSPPPPPPPVSHLCNPLVQPASPPEGEATPSTPGFDFDPDPMSAFTGSMRTSGGRSGSYNPQESFSSPIRSPSPMSLPSPYHLLAGSKKSYMSSPFRQLQVNQSPDLSTYSPRSGSWRSQGPFASPFSVSGTTITNPGDWDRSAGSSGHIFSTNSSRGGFMRPGFRRGGSPMNHSPDSSTYSPRSGSWRSQGPFASPFSVSGTSITNPGGWDRSASSSGHIFSTNSSRGGFMSPGFGRGGSPMHNLGGGSQLFLSGRRNWQSGGSASPGRTGGRYRGRGFYEHGSSHQVTGNFYCKVMVEDPWRELKPIVGNILVARGGPDSWLPKSLTEKKPKIEESGREFSSQSSLAESLAFAFEEAVNERDA